MYIWHLFFALYAPGKQKTGTTLAEFCITSLLALEVLIHPRALPLHEFSSFTENFSVNKMNNGTVENVLGGFCEESTRKARMTNFLIVW